MRPINLLIPLVVCSHPAFGQESESASFWQAPESANLWRVAASALTAPPALQSGPIGISWNPAAALDTAGLLAAVQALHTPSVQGLSGISAAVSRSIGPRGWVSLTGGRLDMRDLVRTRGSPNSEGSIPVFVQFAGLAGQVRLGRLGLGGLFRIHDTRFDVLHESGATMDLGAQYRASTRLNFAVASHFLPLNLSEQEATDYYGGLEYSLVSSTVIGGVTAGVVGRYGVTYRASEALEHVFGCGIVLGGHFQLRASLARETAVHTHAWRPGLAVSIQIGRYQLDMARSSGLNDLGATYQVGLEATILP